MWFSTWLCSHSKKSVKFTWAHQSFLIAQFFIIIFKIDECLPTELSLQHSSTQLREPFMPPSSPLVAIQLQTPSSEVYEQCLRRKNYTGQGQDNSLPSLPTSNAHFRPSYVLSPNIQWKGLNPSFIPFSQVLCWFYGSSHPAGSLHFALNASPVLWHRQSAGRGIKLLGYFEDQWLLFLKCPHCSTLELVHLNPLIDGC